MAFFGVGNYCLLILALIFIYSNNLIRAQTKAPNRPVANNDAHAKCKETIAKRLEALEESDMTQETKLTRVIISKTENDFFLYGDVDGTELFSWSNPQNVPASSKDILILDMKEVQPTGKLESGWKTRMFLALKPCNSPSIKSTKNMIHYYALVAYERVNAFGITVEWDRWWPKVAQSLTEARQLDSLEVEHELFSAAILCAYGSCACSGCDCEPSKKSQDVNANMTNKGPVRKVGNAYAKAEAEKRGESRANAVSENGTAVSESIAYVGDSLSYAKGRDHAVAEADTEDGSAKSLSVAERGFAQSSAQSASDDDDIMAKAEKIAGQNNDYDNPSDLDYGDDDSFEAGSLFNATDGAFRMALERSLAAKAKAKGERRGGTCIEEKNINIVISNKELSTFVKGSEGSQNANKTIAFENPLNIGMDIDGAINNSVSVTVNTNGFSIPRTACSCNPPDAKSTSGTSFLKFLHQNCRTDLDSLMKRVEKYNPSDLDKWMNLKILSQNQVQDIVPMILLTFYTNKAKDQSVQLIRKVFKNATSPGIAEITAIAVNALHHSVTAGRLHKVKLLKSLSLNVQNVWIGLLLESKRCGKEKSCDEEYLETLTKDQNLMYGLFLFLKAADALYTNAPREANPTEVFIRFIHFYKVEIAKETDCKVRRVIAY